jgi:hypothetical protein
VPQRDAAVREPLLCWEPMRRYVIWYILSAFWAAIAVAGLLHHQRGNAALEGAVAVLFLIMGIFVKRRDAGAASRYTANRPK